jgi:cation/acetate symporter
VVAGLTISASTSFAHDFWTSVVHRGVERSPNEEVRVARITAFVVGMVAIGAAIVLGPGANVAFLVGLAFAVAASANLPAILLSLFWRRFNTAGAVSGLAAGLAASILLILIGPAVRGANAIFPLENPGIVSIPAGFLAAYLGTVLSNDRASEEKYPELLVRANTGLGAEKATPH